MSGESPQRIVKFREGTQVWRVRQDVRPWLFSKSKPGEIRQTPMTRIKHSRAKIVCRFTLPSPEGQRVLYLKTYITRNYATRPLKYAFRTSPAMEEWRLAKRLEARGVPIAPHLAVGEDRTFRMLQEATLITEGLTGYVTVSDFCQRGHSISPQLRHAFARELGRFVRILHDGGVLQVDLHGANLLLRVTPEGQPEFRLVDLDGIKLCRRVPRSQRFSNLITLHIYFASISSRTDRLRFIRAYLGADEAKRLPSVARRLEAVAWRALKFSRRERARRCLKSNRDFGLFDAGGMTWQVRQSAINSKLELLLEHPNRLLSQPRDLLKNGRSSTVGRSGGFILKRANRHKFFTWIKDLFRPSPAESAFLKAYHLELCGIPTPMAVAFADRRSFRFLTYSYLVTMELPSARHLQAFLQQETKLQLSERRRLLRQLAHLVAALHDAGFSHRDLKAPNILVTSPDHRLFLVDLDGVHDVGELPIERVRKDLARLERTAQDDLGCSRRERLRFLVEYQWALRDRRLRKELLAPR